LQRGKQPLRPALSAAGAWPGVERGCWVPPDGQPPPCAASAAAWRAGPCSSYRRPCLQLLDCVRSCRYKPTCTASESAFLVQVWSEVTVPGTRQSKVCKAHTRPSPPTHKLHKVHPSACQRVINCMHSIHSAPRRCDTAPGPHLASSGRAPVSVAPAATSSCAKLKYASKSRSAKVSRTRLHPSKG